MSRFERSRPFSSIREQIRMRINAKLIKFNLAEKNPIEEIYSNLQAI